MKMNMQTLTENKLSARNSSKAKPLISVFSYTSYQSFLLDYLQAQKKVNIHFTLGMWSKKLSLANTASLSRILDGKRLPGPELIQKLISYFGFNEVEADYFRYLVLLEKNKGNSEMVVLIMEKLTELNPNKKFQIIDHQTFMAVSQWYYFAIREMVLLNDFKEDGAWIAQKLLFHITPGEAQKAVQTLLDLGLISRNEKTGKLYQKDAFIDWKSDVISEASKRNHEQNLDNAKFALRNIDIKEREFNSVCMNVANGDIEKMKKYIQSFKSKFIEKFECREKAEATYQMQIQLFPFTK